jgi:hypothetical protein
LGNLRKRDPLGDLRARRILLKRVFKRREGQAWTGLIWLRIRTGNGLF